MARRAKGEGSLYQDKEGKWVYQYRENGKRKTKRFQKKIEAKIFIDSQTSSLLICSASAYPLTSEVVSSSTDISVESWMKTWLETYARPSIKLSTYACYEQYIRNHINPLLGDRPMSSLKPIDLQNFFNDRAVRGNIKEEKGLSPKSLTNLRNMMHISFDQAMREGLIRRNLIEDVRLPKMPKREMRVLSRKEQERLIVSAQLAPEPSAFGVVFAMFTGLRLGEICALKWKNVDMEKRVVYVDSTRKRLPNFDDSIKTSTSVIDLAAPKTEASIRSVPIMKRLYDDIVKYKDLQDQIAKEYPGYNAGGYVFCQESGKPYEPDSFVGLFQRCVKRAAIPYTNFHCLRHTFATRSLEQGMDVATLAKMMGHSNPSVTLQKYAHALPDHQQESIEKLDSLYDPGEMTSAVPKGPTMEMSF